MRDIKLVVGRGKPKNDSFSSPFHHPIPNQFEDKSIPLGYVSLESWWSIKSTPFGLGR